jgi:hypothetical protein
MKVLVATRESQGMRGRDLWRSCIEGELVRPIEERCSPGPCTTCSCTTAFIGLVSGGLTTTAAVRELPALSMPDYADELRSSLTRRERRRILVDRYAEELARAAEGLHGSSGPVERWDDWMAFRFDEDGALRDDVTGLADVDPAVLRDLG